MSYYSTREQFTEDCRAASSAEDALTLLRDARSLVASLSDSITVSQALDCIDDAISNLDGASQDVRERVGGCDEYDHFPLSKMGVC